MRTFILICYTMIILNNQHVILEVVEVACWDTCHKLPPINQTGHG